MNTTGSETTFKQVVLDLFGKDEFYFVGWAVLFVLIVLIVACCIGCKGCCCRACCGARETRASFYMCKVPKATKSNNECQHVEHTVVQIPSERRCCYHPQHCRMELDTTFLCPNRRICIPCNLHVSKGVDKCTNTGHQVEIDNGNNSSTSKTKRQNAKSTQRRQAPVQESGFNFRPPVGAWSYHKETPYPACPSTSQMGITNSEAQEPNERENEEWGG